MYYVSVSEKVRGVGLGLDLFFYKGGPGNPF